MEKKSKGKTIIIVILVLTVLGLSGYIVYDKVLNKKNDEPVKTEKTKKNKTEGIFNLEHKSEIQKLYSEVGTLYIDKVGKVFLEIDDLTDIMGSDELEKNIMNQLEKLHQNNTIDGVCLTGDEDTDKIFCENGDVVKSIKLDIDDAISGYYIMTGQGVESGGFVIIRADGTISAISVGDLLDGKVKVKNNIKNLKNIVTIAQSSNINAYEAIAIEKDGTQHIIEYGDMLPMD